MREKRGTAIGIWGGITGLGVATAPLLGGAIIQGIGWQWIFWINVPIGVLSAVAASRTSFMHGIKFAILVAARPRRRGVGWGYEIGECRVLRAYFGVPGRV